MAAFPGFTDKRQVSNTGGGQARWRADGKELYYLSLDGKIMAVDIRTTPGLEAGIPRQLFETRVGGRANPVWDQDGVTAGGPEFPVVEVVKERPRPITVILDWPALLPSRR